jgi:uncharacterized membrane-anchored protein YhcB (DUF1043 family)
MSDVLTIVATLGVGYSGLLLWMFWVTRKLNRVYDHILDTSASLVGLQAEFYAEINRLKPRLAHIEDTLAAQRWQSPPNDFAGGRGGAGQN